MPMQDVNPDLLLSTTRAVRKRLDLERPVPQELLLECLELAVQAPSGSNRQAWRFLFLTQREPKRLVAEYYSLAYDSSQQAPWPSYPEGDVRGQRQPKVIESSDYLRDHLHEVPAMLLACREGRLPENASAMRLATFYGSILPAWSFMLAARARGLGTAFTTTHLDYEREVAQALYIPFDHYTQVALVPIGFVKGEDLKPAARIPLDTIVRWERW